MVKRVLSVIVPVYNVEEYLREALDSVVQQDLGFEDNIQLIVVNDGSPDRSEDICLEYQRKYPNNILYIAQNNQGVSTARNKGLEAATGKYIAFFDPDDKLSSDAYRVTIDFFEKHYEEIDIAAFKMKFFERFTGDHPLNYRFDKTRVVDIRKEPTYMQSSGVSCIFKAEALQRKRFDINIKYAEDMKLINEILLDKMAYGVVDGPVYYVRKRMNENSASNTGHMNPEYYTVTPVKVFKHLFDLWERTNGKLDEFIQFVVLFDVQWRISQRSQIALTADQELQYKNNIYDLVRRVTNDEIIMGMKNMKAAYKLFLLRKKYGEAAYNKQISITNGRVHFKGKPIDRVLGYNVLPRIGIDIIKDLGGGRFQIEGHVSGLLTEKSKFWIETTRGKFYPVANKLREVTSRNIFLEEQADINKAFSVTVDMNMHDRVKFLCDTNGTASMEIKIGPHCRLGNISGAYTNIGNVLIEKRNSVLYVTPDSLTRRAYLEVKFLLTVLFRLKIGVAARELKTSVRHKLQDEDLDLKAKIISVVKPCLVPFKALVSSLITVALRLSVRMAKMLKRQEIWIISDRISNAADNGEAFYRYLQRRNVDIRYYFAINKKTDAYSRLQGEGFRLVNLLGFKYKFLVLLADKVISSNADEMIFNPFLDNLDRYADLRTHKFIFLQHGITKDDLSRQYNRWNTGFDMFITSTQKEYDSIVNNKRYGFGRDVVKLTGMPRLDELEDKKTNKIALLPTWRKGLDGGLDKKTGFRQYSPTFKETEYFKFYNSILSDKKLAKALAEHNITGEFYLHPSFEAQAVDFDQSESFKIQKMPYDFQKIFSESCLMITDYSSVAFDFAYLRKPVIYAQFDRKTFFNNHTYKEGYFSYTEDGFGPVVENRQQLVEMIIKYLSANCEIEHKYMKRVDNAFKYSDKNNSKRVYEAILAMNK